MLLLPAFAENAGNLSQPLGKLAPAAVIGPVQANSCKSIGYRLMLFTIIHQFRHYFFFPLRTRWARADAAARRARMLDLGLRNTLPAALAAFEPVTLSLDLRIAMPRFSRGLAHSRS